MRVMRKEAAVKYGLFCLALVPALLFAYLGHFSRLMWDDYSSPRHASRTSGSGKPCNIFATPGTALYKLSGLRSFCTIGSESSFH